jgi:hypothetical protein
MPDKQAWTPVDPLVDKVRTGKALRNLLKFAKVGDDDDLECRYASVVGCNSIGSLLSSNFVEQSHVRDDASAGLKRIRKEPDMQMAVQIERFHIVPASRVDVSIPQLKSMSRVYTRAGVSSISSLDFVEVPVPHDPLGFGFELVVASVLFGSDIQRDIGLTRRLQKQRNSGSMEIDWIDARKKLQVEEAVARVLDPPLVGGPASRRAAELAGIDDWMKGARLRAFIKLQMLSMLPLKKRLAAAGRGTQILEPALKAAEVRVKAAAKLERPVIHDDAMLHFWFEELRRLKLDDVRLPLIRLR